MASSLAKDTNAVSIQSFTSLVVVEPIGDDRRVAPILRRCARADGVGRRVARKRRIVGGGCRLVAVRARRLGEHIVVHAAVGLVKRLTVVPGTLGHPEDFTQRLRLLRRKVKGPNPPLHTSESVVAERRNRRDIDVAKVIRHAVRHDDAAKIVRGKGGDDVGLARRCDTLALRRDDGVERDDHALLTLKLGDAVKHLLVKVVGLDEVCLKEDVGECIGRIRISSTLVDGLAVARAQELYYKFSALA